MGFQMLRIGEFAELSTISIHMLRNYDKIGLLVPKSIDQESGYRYYDKEQLIQANQIIALKSMGFGLDEIKEILCKQQTEVTSFFKNKLQEKQLELHYIEEQIRQMRGILHSDSISKNNMLSIAKKTIDAMWVISYRGTIYMYPEEGKLWALLREECAKNKIKIAEHSPAMAIYHGAFKGAAEMEVEVQFPIDKEYAISGNASIKSYPEREIVSVVFKGSYSQISSINRQVAEWLEKNLYEISGQSFSIYHNSPGNCVNDKEFITELCFPIRKIELDSRIM